jgi:glycosyl transferase family 87
LTSRRLRTHGLLLGLTLWSLYLWTLATPGLRDRNGNLKGTDFLHLYTLGSLAIAHRGATLYDMDAQAGVAAQRVPPAAGIRYLPLYPPQVSICFVPLALFSYGAALIVWWLCTAVLYSVCCYAIWRSCPSLHAHGATVTILGAAFPPFFHLIAWGQTSAVALACFTGMYFLLRDRREFLAGIVLGCLIFKPQLGLAAGIVFVAIGAWKILAGAALSSAAQLAVGVLYYGMEPFRQWLHLLRNLRSLSAWFEPRPYQTHCLRTFWSMMIPWQGVAVGLYLLSAALILLLTIVMWKRGQGALSLRYSALLLATVLVAPHLTVYDLVILAPAILLLANWLIGQARESGTEHMGLLLYAVYVLPLVGPFARYTHVQLSVVAMAALLHLTWRKSASGSSQPSANELQPAGTA